MQIPLFFIDFEGAAHCGIIEYGVLEMLGRDIVSSATRLCCPEGEIFRRDQAVHGLAPAELQRQPPFGVDWDFFAGIRQRGILCAHHAPTENALLCRQWPYPRFSPDFLQPGRETATWGPWLDTERLCRLAWPGLEGYGLEELVSRLQLQERLDKLARDLCPIHRRGYHRALYDALAAALLLDYLQQQAGWDSLSESQLLRISLNGPSIASEEQPELF